MPDALRAPDYPWQRRAPAAPEWAPLGATTEAERRRRCCASMFDLSEILRDEGCPEPHGLVYDPRAG